MRAKSSGMGVDSARASMLMETIRSDRVGAERLVNILPKLCVSGGMRLSGRGGGCMAEQSGVVTDNGQASWSDLWKKEDY